MREWKIHTDATQALMKIECGLRHLPVDLITVGGHKIGGVRGAGALLMRKDYGLATILRGGSQEQGYRS